MKTFNRVAIMTLAAAISAPAMAIVSSDTLTLTTTVAATAGVTIEDQNDTGSSTVSVDLNGSVVVVTAHADVPDYAFATGTDISFAPNTALNNATVAGIALGDVVPTVAVPLVLAAGPGSSVVATEAAPVTVFAYTDPAVLAAGTGALNLLDVELLSLTDQEIGEITYGTTNAAVAPGVYTTVVTITATAE